ncbi:MAG: YebC/PmpR family DNA-binding transcriptional regulator [Candidatus Phytoplasma sp.]|nr:YebC/PmpR family DNA-binding transcriptional regulator [Phytoplasma sp.]
MGRAFEVRKVAMAKTAASKSKVYARYGKEIYMAAKSGTPDPEMNLNLKRLIEKAKKDQVPADVIKRAIEKAKGGSDESYNEIRYEGFGPNNSLFIIDCLTDNVNRTIAEVRNCFTKTGGKIGVSGSVAHQFEHASVFKTVSTEDQIIELMIEKDVNVDDIEVENEHVIIYGKPSDFYLIKTVLTEANLPIDEEMLTWLPLATVTMEETEDNERFEKLMDMLNEIDDVQEIYHNVV